MDELRHVMKNLPQKVTDEELALIFSEVDKDGNGEIDYDEFRTLMIVGK